MVPTKQNALKPAHRLTFEQHFVPVPDGLIHYAEVANDRPPMLLVHGIGMDWRVWQAISRWLTPFFHLYLLDLRGHGESFKPQHGYRLADYAADVEDVLEALQLEGATLVGSSLGAMVTLAVEAPPDMVSYRILADPPLTGGPVRDTQMFHEILKLKHQPVPALAKFLAERNPGMGAFLSRAMSEMWHEASDGVITDMLSDSRHYNDLAASLGEDLSPTLVMQADQTKGGVLTDDGARRALELLPYGSFVHFEGAGHAIHAYQPEKFTRQILKFTGTRTRADSA
ncbi:MAG: alpha/beta fold hydrolase [Chloroflexota bacterium]